MGVRKFKHRLKLNRGISIPKIILTATVGSKQQNVLGKTEIGLPGVGATQTFITVGAFDTREEAENCEKYLKTKFARAMLSIWKATQHNPPDTFKAIPLQNFTPMSDIDWSKPLPEIDRQLYRKYKLNLKEVTFIEGNIKYRE